MHRISTGSAGVDGLLEGGWKRGAIVEIWGGPGTGKTTLAQHAVADLDVHEEALWLSLGTEVPHRAIRASKAVPRTAEEAFSIMAAGLHSHAALIVVDSANGLVRQREIDGDPDYEPSPHREFKSELSDLRDLCSETLGTVLFLSKPRDKERSPIRGTGVSEKAVQRVNLKILKSHQDGSRLIEASLKTGETCEYVVRPGTGIDWAEELLRTAYEHDIVSSNGSWWMLPGKVVQGKEAACDYVRGYPKLAAYLNTEIRKDLHIY